MAATIRSKIFSGIIWQGMERLGTQAISLLTSIILARLLAPSEFGLLTIMLVFTSIGEVIIDCGLNNALIQKPQIDDDDCSSVFFANISLSLILYAVLFFMAPWVSRFYGVMSLVPMLRVLGLVMVIRSFSQVQQALLFRRMQFRLNFKITWCALIASGTVGCVMAFLGFGVWSLVCAQLTTAMVCNIGLFYFVRFCPRWFFSWKKFSGLLNFGSKLMLGSLLDAVYNKVFSLFVGKFYSVDSLSFYERGNHLPFAAINSITGTIGSVLFPAFSEVQNDRESLRRIVRSSLRISMFIVTPLLGLFILEAEPVILILFSEKWREAIPYMQIAAIVYIYWPAHRINLQLISACGRSDVLLYLEIFKKVEQILIVFWFYRYGLLWLALSNALFSPMFLAENMWFCRRLIHYGIWDQYRDILPIFLAAGVSGGISWLLTGSIANLYLRLLLGGGCFLVGYILLMWVSRQIPEEILNLPHTIAEKYRSRAQHEKSA